MLLKSLTPAEITNLYLYGTISTPNNLVNDALIRLPSATTAVDVDTVSFMQTIGRFAIGSQFELVQKFFNPSIFDPIIAPGAYTKSSLRTIFGISDAGWNMQHTDYQDGFDDYAERVYIWNSQSYQIGDDAVFQVFADGTREISNFAIQPRKDVQENFDFVGGGLIASFGNGYLEPRVDPSNIGRVVNIQFSGSPLGYTYDAAAYWNDRQRSESWEVSSLLNLPKLISDMDKLLDNLFTGGVTKFLDGNKPIVYGTTGDDLILDPYNFLKKDPFLSSFKGNGIVILGGMGKDTIAGFNNDDKLLGGEGMDELFGAGGDDVLYGGDGIDTAYYRGDSLDYDIFKNQSGTWTVRHVRGTKDSGSDLLIDIERISFVDQTKGETWFISGGKKFDLATNGITFQTDFALVIDTTGSMGSSINSVKAQSAALIDAVFAGGKNDGRIAVVGFKDVANGEPSQVILPFTDQDEFEDRKAAATAAINSITVGGGGDLPETDFDGLLLALNGSAGTWRVGAGTRRIALFTDAPVKDTELAAQVTAIAQNIGATIASRSSLRGFGGSVDTFNLTFDSLFSEPTARVQIFTIFTGPSYLDTAPLSAIALDNGGAFLTAPSNDELVKKLLEIINTPPTSSAISISFAENITDTVYSFNSNPSTGSTLSYSITGTDASIFKIDSTTGAINFKTAPNFESPTDSGANNIYNINVAASDGISTNSQALAITVTDVNEAPSITSGSNANFAENGMGIVYTVTAADSDAGTTLNYSITGTDASLFNIDRLTGAIAFKSVPDFEYPTDNGANNVYNINAIASDGTLSSSQSLAISVNNINEPLGSNLQWNPEGGEVLDLRFTSGLPTNTKFVRVDFDVTRSGDFKDFVGFYKVADVNGGIDTNGDDITDLTPGQNGYMQAAIANRVKGMDLTVKNQGKASFKDKFNPNSIFAPFIIANGTLNQLLDHNPANDPAVYFPFLGANSDRSDHVRMLATNVFGFEDLPYGGDRDFDDIIVKVTLTPVK
jgi:hypothetical protein